MRTLAMWGLIATLLPLGAQADVYISQAADGALTLSNVYRDDREYLRVYREPAMAAVTPVGGAALAAASEKSMTVAQRPYAQMISAAAVANDLPVELLHAVIRNESRYNPLALSIKGAAGLMQLMPDTAREMGVSDIWDPAANIQGGARYLKRLMVMFSNDISLALAAYNAGPAAVSKRGGTIPPYPETQRYVPSVLRDYQQLLGASLPVAR